MTDAPINAGPPRRIRVGDVALNVQVAGEGEPVLLLHGVPDSLTVWREVTPQLVAAGYRVIAFDQRGFGESDAPADGGNELVPRQPDKHVVRYLSALPCTDPLGMWSSGDRYLTEAQMQASGRLVDAAWEYRRIDNRGHWISLQRPDAVASAALDWFGRHPLAPAAG